MDDINAWLDEGQPLEAKVPVCLSGDLHQQHLQKCEELGRLVGRDDLSLDDDRIPRLRDEIEDLRARIEKATRTITVRALEPGAYYRLVVAHPPRDDDDLDKRHGVNYDTFTAAIVEAATDLTAEQVEKLRTKVSFRQWSELWQSARDLCTGEVDVPKSLPAFAPTRSSGDE